MPYKIEKQSGRRPWKIINSDTEKIVGSSLTKKDAKTSARIRMQSKGEYHSSGNPGSNPKKEKTMFDKVTKAENAVDAAIGTYCKMIPNPKKVYLRQGTCHNILEKQKDFLFSATGKCKFADAMDTLRANENFKAEVEKGLNELATNGEISGDELWKIVEKGEDCTDAMVNMAKAILKDQCSCKLK